MTTPMATVVAGDRVADRRVLTPRRRLAGAAVALAVFVGLGHAEAQEIDVVEMTIADVHAGYAARAFTAVQLTEAFLARIAEHESTYNAFISMNPDALATEP